MNHQESPRACAGQASASPPAELEAVSLQNSADFLAARTRVVFTHRDLGLCCHVLVGTIATVCVPHSEEEAISDSLRPEVASDACRGRESWRDVVLDKRRCYVQSAGSLQTPAATMWNMVR